LAWETVYKYFSVGWDIFVFVQICKLAKNLIQSYLAMPAQVLTKMLAIKL
jgi:hypothetical protein